MAKWRDPDVRKMTDSELRAEINLCSARERILKAPYAKARRGYSTRRRAAEAELARREADAS
jgi:hypothetical protein